MSLVNALVLLVAAVARQTSGTATLSRPMRLDHRGIGEARLSAGRNVILNVTRDRDGTTGALDGTLAVWGANLPHPQTGAPLGNAYAAAATPVANTFRPDGSALTFQTDIPFVAFANYNWLVEVSRFRLTGTVAVAAGVVTGTGTDFDPQLDVGDQIEINGRRMTVTARTSDTAAVLDDTTFTVAAGAVAFNVARAKRMKTYAAAPAGPEQYSVTNVGGFALITFAVAPPIALDVNGVDLGETSVNVYFVTPVQVLADGTHPFNRSRVLSRTVMWTSGTHAANLLAAGRVTVEPATE